MNTIEIEIANADLGAHADDVGLERSAFLRTHAPALVVAAQAETSTTEANVA